MRDPRRRPWGRSPRERLADLVPRADPVACTICGWHGGAFGGFAHSESAVCPRCGSIARDRFLYHCWTARRPYRPGERLLETSPRLGAAYREHMSGLVDYLASDYDERAHKGAIHLDLQNIDLTDGSLDVILTSHVLEHVPDTHQALSEIRRVLAPGGVAYIMVPLPQAQTAPPKEPEYHGDQTLVYWRFGWDLADLIARSGFQVETLVTADLARRARTGEGWGHVGPDVDSDDVLAGARDRVDDFVVVADDATTARYGFLPSFFFVVWECRR